jgi:glycosyltransferase involved in cell wall biosynthesis
VSARAISVVIAVLNGAATIGQALAGVAAQSRPPVEIVVVNDGSTDETREVVQSWAGLLPIKYLELPDNVGLGSARRRGISHAQGDWIAVLDADDFWLPDHLLMLDRAAESDLDLVCGPLVSWHPGSGVGLRPYPASLPRADQQLAALLRRNQLSIGTLFSRRLYDEAGGFSADRRAEDWDLWIRMVLAGATIRAPSSPTMLYRVTPSGLSSSPALYLDALAVLRRYEQLPGYERHADVGLRWLRAEYLLGVGLEAARAGHRQAARRAFLHAAAAAWPVAHRTGREGLRRAVRPVVSALAPQHAVRRRHRWRRSADG